MSENYFSNDIQLREMSFQWNVLGKRRISIPYLASQSHNQLFTFLLYPSINKVFGTDKLDYGALGGGELQGMVNVTNGVLVAMLLIMSESDRE